MLMTRVWAFSSIAEILRVEMIVKQAAVGEHWAFSFIVKTAACSMMPGANLGVFSLKSPIIIMEILLGESVPTRSQESVDTLSGRREGGVLL